MKKKLKFLLFNNAIYKIYYNNTNKQLNKSNFKMPFQNKQIVEQAGEQVIPPHFLVSFDQKEKYQIFQLLGRFSKDLIVPENCEKTRFTNYRRKTDNHKYHFNVDYTNQKGATFGFDVAYSQRRHHVICDDVDCYGWCYDGKSPFRTDNDVTWCVSHKHVNGFVVDFTRVDNILELFNALEIFLVDFQFVDEPVFPED